MKKLFSIFILLSVLLQCIVFSNAEAPGIEASNYMLLDLKSGQILCEKNPEEKLYPASTTKVMTAIIALEKGDLNQMMTASKAAVNDIGVDGMNIGIMAGEVLRLEDLLNAMLVRSANETSNIIAENICPTRKEFVDLMNSKAKELGAVNTNFVNPCGAHNPNHYSTVSDMAKIAQYAMSIPKFKEIVAKSSFNMPPTNKHPNENWGRLPSTNKILGTKSNYFLNVTGVKTGYTSQAGNNLVSSSVNDKGMELISVIMNLKSPGADKNVFNYSKELLEYGYKNFSIQKFVNAGQVVMNVPVVNAENDAKLDLITASDMETVLPVDKESWNITQKEYITDNIKAPVTLRK